MMGHEECHAERKRYSEEFKREAVGLTRLPGANVSQPMGNFSSNAHAPLNLHLHLRGILIGHCGEKVHFYLGRDYRDE